MNKKERVQMVIDRLLKNGNAVASSDGSAHEIFPVAVNRKEGEALQKWITKEKALHTIEIGLGYGISALYILQGLIESKEKNIRHIVLDPFQATRFKNCGLQFLEEAGLLELVDYYPEESQIALPRFVSEGRTFDFAFVDGSHFFDRVFLDLIYLERLVRRGGVIFVDDYQLPAVARAVHFGTKNLGWVVEEVSPLDKEHQWAVLRIPSEPAQRAFPHFVDF